MNYAVGVPQKRRPEVEFRPFSMVLAKNHPFYPQNAPASDFLAPGPELRQTLN
jgi:hypothetical protein